MRRYEVYVLASAERDLEAMSDWIAVAESRQVAIQYIDRVRAFIANFGIAPERGTRLRNGRRRIGFERRCTILFRVREHDVLIERVFARGRRSPTE